MPDTLTWVVLPKEISRDRSSLILSLTATPAVESASGQLGDSRLADWPALLRSTLDNLSLRVAGSANRHRLTVVDPTSSSDTWRRVFPRTAPVGVPPGGPTMRLPKIDSGVAYDRAHTAAAQLYEQVLRTSPTEPLRRDHPVARAIMALGRLTAGFEGGGGGRSGAAAPDPVLSLLDPANSSGRSIDDAVAALLGAGRPDDAAAAPLVPLVIAQRRAARGSKISDPQTPGPLPDLEEKVPAFDRADVHQVWGVMSEHPTMARRLGIVVDLAVAVVPELIGAATIRVEGPNGRLPLADAFTEVSHPWSRVEYLPKAGMFVMVPGGGEDDEIVSGMLDLNPDPGDAAYLVGDLDVRSIARQLQLIAAGAGRRDSVPELAAPRITRTIPRAIGARASVGAPAVPPSSSAAAAGDVVLPVRRDPGFVIAQTRRAERALAPALALPGRVADPVGSRGSVGEGKDVDGEAILFADDVTAGYRVDVSRNGGPFRSLMKRVVRYGIDGVTKDPVIVHDEGTVEALVAVAEVLDSGAQVLIGEEVFGWDGWSLATGLPGPSVIADAAGAPSTGVVGSRKLDGYGLAMSTAPEPGSLPALRYGDTYSFAARAVDIAGNSLPPEAGPRPHASAPVVFRRHDPVPPPRLVPRRAFHPAETLTRLVVRSDGFGHPLDQGVSRHLLPPAVAQRLAERHGVFDAAFGPDSPERRSARRKLLTVASRESAGIADPMVSDGRGGLVPAVGIAVVAPTGSPAVLPLPAGEPLPAGQYVIHDTAAMRIPDLPDPGASGVLLAIPLAGPEGWWASYGSADWPNAKPVRLDVRAVTGTAEDITVTTTATGDVIDVPVPPGAQWDMTLSSTIPPAVVDVMDPLGSASARALAIDGFILAFSPRQPVSFLHATRAPAADPELVVVNNRGRGLSDTRISFDARLSAHRDTTARVDALARWTEVTDTGVGPLITQTRLVVLDSRTIEPFGPAAENVLLQYDFGDTLRRDVGLSAVGATRFRDCFPELEPGDPSMLRSGSEGQLQVPNSRVPEPPVVHSVIPTFRWERSFTGGVHRSRRVANGVRVYLKRPWLTTGEGERLGVIAYAKEIDNTNAAGALGNPNDDHPYANVVSRWGMDPVELRTPLTPPLTAASFGGDGLPIVPRGVVVPPGVGAVKARVVTFPVTFDAELGLWFADVTVDRTMHNQPYFLRLGLVRYQPVSVDGAQASRVVQTDWIPMPPTQSVTVKVTGSQEVEVEVFDALAANRRYTAGLELRTVPAGSVKTASKSDITFEGIPPVELTKIVASSSRLVARGTVRNLPGSVDHDLYRIGRLVIREEQTGEDVRFPGGSRRVVFFETIDWTTLFPLAS